MSEVNPILAYADSYRLMARDAKNQGRLQTVSMWSVVADLERNIAPILDRVTAERDAALGRESALREELDLVNLSFDSNFDAAQLARRERDALQLRLNAADQRNDNRDSEIFAQVQSALRRSFSLGQIYWQQADSDSTCQQNKSDQTMGVQEQHILSVLNSLGAALKPAEARRNQCDGCQAGIPVVNGAHRIGKPGGYPHTMSCTAKLYKP